MEMDVIIVVKLKMDISVKIQSLIKVYAKRVVVILLERT
jgi:hypothetical protein